jgi:methylenetetrahydrofolate dehydrogenase (NADP+) / methenyltetrahydrofolate cyclohydrolase
MTAIKLDGDAVAARIKDDLQARIAALAERGVVPGLGTVLVGDDGPSANYVAMKQRDCAELGMQGFHQHLPGDAGEADVLGVVRAWNADRAVDAYLLQYPFPGHLDFERILLAVDPDKDVDGLHPVNLGKLVQGVEAPLACTPAGIQRLLAAYEVPIEGRHVVIVGRGLTIGRPLANLLSLKRPLANAAVTVVHTGVKDLGAHTRTADILVAAAGSPGLITPDMVKPGAAVIRGGVSFVDGKLRSDVAKEVDEVAGWASPATGGVGAMTRAMLLANTVAAAERRAGR